MDFANDSQEYIDCELDTLINKAATNGFSEAGVKRLKNSIDKYKQIFKLRPRTGGPVRVPPTKMEQDGTKLPVTVKA